MCVCISAFGLTWETLCGCTFINVGVGTRIHSGEGVFMCSTARKYKHKSVCVCVCERESVLLHT